MSSLIPKNGVLLNYAESAEAPCKDFCQVYVTTDQFIFRRWKVAIRKHAEINPGQIKCSHEEFLHDESAEVELRLAFGTPMLEYVIGLAEGRIDYLPRLPKDLLIRIIGYVPLEDLHNINQVSRQFRALCHGDDLWEQLYRDHSASPISHELETLAEAIGWKQLFFTHKLQLQRLLKRLSSGEISQAVWARHLDIQHERAIHSHDEDNLEAPSYY